MLENKKDNKGLDELNTIQYNKGKMDIINIIKENGQKLAKYYSHNIKIELNINLQYNSTKLNIEEFNI